MINAEFAVERTLLRQQHQAVSSDRRQTDE